MEKSTVQYRRLRTGTGGVKPTRPRTELDAGYCTKRDKIIIPSKNLRTCPVQKKARVSGDTVSKLTNSAIGTVGGHVSSLLLVWNLGTHSIPFFYMFSVHYSLFRPFTTNI